MPEIKHNFTAGKMNKDLDERLVPNGEYRHAENIQVRTTDNSDAGAVQGIQGNMSIGTGFTFTGYPDAVTNVPSDQVTKCVGSIADEKSDKGYFFMATPKTIPTREEIIATPGIKVYADVIVEKDFSEPFVENNINGGDVTPVVVDWHMITCDYASAGSPTPSGTFNSINLTGMTNNVPIVGMIVESRKNTSYDQMQPNTKIIAVSGTTIYLDKEQTAGAVDGSTTSFWFIRPEEDRLLNFDYETEDKITGINIIDDILLWSDGRNEPKKINITRCIHGSGIMAGINAFTSPFAHTKLIVKDPSNNDLVLVNNIENLNTLVGVNSPDNDLKKEHITVIRKAPTTAPNITMRRTTRESPVQGFISGDFFFEGGTPEVNSVRVVDLDGLYGFRVNDILTFTDYTTEGMNISITAIVTDVATNESTGMNSITIELSSIDPDLTALNTNWEFVLNQPKPLFELKLGRIGYRYRYDDGEYSTFSPWSELVFQPDDFSYTPSNGYNNGMVNGVREITVRDFIPNIKVRPNDVKSVDVLFKTTDDQNVYIIKTITRRIDNEWDNFVDEVSENTGKIVLTSELIHKVVESKQLLRSWDNVPKKALSQEIVGNRVVYGNYEQGFDIDTFIGLQQQIVSEDTTLLTPEKSVKSVRSYKWGMVFSDEFGRQTPVLSSSYTAGPSANSTNSTGDIVVPKDLCAKSNHFKLTQQWDDEPPTYFSSVSYYVKETSSEYYNLVMDRWYDAEDGNIWLSFPSSDRSKVDEETYLILKNENGNQTPVLEEARYKILAIENDVPEFVKLDQRTMGETERINNIDIYGETNGAEGMQSSNGATTSGTPDAYKNTLELVHPDKLKVDEDTFRGVTKWVRVKAVHPGSNKTLYSKWVKVARFEYTLVRSGANFVNSSETQYAYKTILSESFGDEIDFNYTFAGLGLDVGAGTDANFGDMGDGSGIHWFLQYRDDVSESKAEFDGRFFVKIENDSIITSKITKQSNTDYQILSTYAIAYISMDPDPWFDTWASSLYSGYDPSINNANPNAQNQGNSAGVNYTGADWDDYGTGLNSTTWVHWIWFQPLEGLSSEAINNWGFAEGYSQNGDPYSDWKFHVVSGNSSHVEDVAEYVDENLQEGEFGPPAGWDFINKSNIFYGLFSSYWQMMSNQGAFEGLPYNYDQSPPNNDGIIEDFWMAFDQNGASKIFIDNTPVYNGILEPGSRGFFGNMQEMVHLYTPNTDKFAFLNGTRQNSGLFEGSIDVSQTTGDWPFSYSDSMYFGVGEEPGGLVVEGTLGGLTFSTLGSGEDVVQSFNNLKNTFAGGTYFRFTDDPFGTVYKAIDIKWHIQESAEIGGGIFSSSIIDNDTYNIEAGSGNQVQKNFDDDTTNYYNRRTSFVIWFRQIENGVFRKEYVNGGDSGNWRGYGVETDIWDPRSAVAHNGSTSMKIEILKPVPVTGELFEEEQVTSAACWETEPKKNVDMDIYYEASNIVPMRLNEKNIITYTSPKKKVAAYASVSVDRPVYTNGYLQSIAPVVLPTNCYVEDTVGTAVKIFSNGSPINTVLEAGDIIKFHHPDGTTTRSTIKEEIDVDTNGNIVSPSTGLSQQLSGACFSSSLGNQSWFIFDYDQSNAINSIGLSTLNGAPIQPGWIVTGSNVPSFYEIVVQPGGILSLGINTNGLNQLLFNTTNGQPWNFDPMSQFGLTGAPGNVGQLAYNGSTLDLDIFTVTISQPNTGSTGMWKIDTDVYKYAIDLPWHNCYTFGNGVESDRIRDDFNAPTIDNGIKVSTTFLDYKAEKKGSGLIYSGIYNSTSGVNELNEFNMSEKITKDLNPAYGSIQALKTRNTDIVTFCEDKVLKVLANKDALYNADGNTQLTATNRVLGTAVPFAGDYGISKNPESLAWDQYRLYFTDRQRGAVLRLSGDGLTPISNVGMKEWFRDNLARSKSLLGTFDSVNGEYNLTLKFSENISDFYQDLLKLTTENTTISFNEASKGWVSFKSFVPEAGLSVTGKYITAVSDEIYHHYNSSVKLNYFYGTKYDSRIDVLFNDMPSSVKSFKAINYEGSQARVNVFNTETYDGVEYTDSDIYNLEGKEGWWVESFETDLQKGSVKEFIEKEGKWFNFIQGVERVVDTETNLDNINTSEFSVQGIGFPINVNVLDDTDGGDSEDGTEIQVVDINDLQPWAAFTFVSDQDAGSSESGLAGIKHKTFGGDGNTQYEREYGDMIMVEMNLYLKGTGAQLPGSNSTLKIKLADTTTTHTVEHNTLYPLSLMVPATSDNYDSNFKIEFDAVEAELPNAGATILISQPYHTVLGQGGAPKYQSYPTFSSNPYGSGTILSNIQSELPPYGSGSGTDVYGPVEMNTVVTGTNDNIEIDGWRESSVNGSMEYASYEYFPE